MKNIHVIPTDKETRLYLSNYGKELNLASHPKTLYTTGQHIYITSDEEIKEGDWAYVFRGGTHRVEKAIHNDLQTWKKIILTTDQDLINDGVQAIDDEFLEWYVKNPSCEEVEVKRVANGTSNHKLTYEYKIIIQKEEQKQHLIDMMNDDEDLGLYNETFDEYLIRLKDRRTEDDYKYTDEDFEKYDEYIMDSWRCGMSVYKCLEFMYFAEKEIQPEQIWNEEKKKGIKQLIQDHKKETLEEAAERIFPNKMEEYDIFLMGAKWQQEQDAKDIQLLSEEIGYLKRNKI